MPNDPSGDLASKSISDLLLVYGNWRSRLVAAMPRVVHISQELEASSKFKEHEAALKAIVAKIETGEDLTAHLSKRTQIAYEPQASASAPLEYRHDRDLLIADWGIHHLHLSTALESNGSFVRRTGDLLFVIFTVDDAYLINVYPHGSWVLKAVLETVIRNWGEVGVLRKSRFAIGLSQQYGDSDRLELRNAGLAQAIEIDGGVYMPIGQTLAGTPMAVTMQVNTLVWAFREWREKIGDRLAAAYNGKFVYWLPAIIDGQCGFSAGANFVPVGALP